jgi:hypothetical protein
VLSWIIWSAGILMEALLLLRAFQARLLGKYSLFYLYSASVLLMALLLVFPGPYENWYWQAQFLTLIVGYGILLEILNHVLTPYPGAEKFARISGVVAFGAILCFALVHPLIKSQWSADGTMVELERDLRTVQAIFLFLLACVISYYGITIGRNMKGMMLGYGLYIATSLVTLAVRAYAGTSFFDEMHKVIQPLSFDISLVVWLAALWAYHPNPVPESGIQLEADYEACVARTRRMMGGMRASLGKVARP